MSESTPPPPPDNPAGAQPSAGGAPPPPPPPPPSSEPPAAPPSQPGGYQAAPPPPPAAPGGPRPGELLDRFLARLIDGVLLLVVGIIVNSVLVAAIISSGSSGGFGYGGSFGTFSIVSSIITTVIYLGYFAFMESNQGKTLGKMAMKLHVEGPSGEKPSFQEALKRNIWLAYPILGIIPFLGLIGGIAALVGVILIAVQINSDPERRPWTDKFADTRVIKEG